MTAPLPSRLRTQVSPHQFSTRSTADIMRLAGYCCVPAIVLSTWFFGIGTLLNIALAGGTALVMEMAVLRLRGRPLAPALADHSALLSALLLGVVLPPGIGWWLVISASFFAVVVARHCYGGLGQNPFNPAMAGYAALIVVLPQTATDWQYPVPGPDGLFSSPLALSSLVASLQALLDAAPFLPGGDGQALAGPAQAIVPTNSSRISALLNPESQWLQLFNPGSGSGREMVGLGWFAGGLVLLSKRVISWTVPFSLLATFTALNLLWNTGQGIGAAELAFARLFGSDAVLCAFFLATDPVTSPSTRRGKTVYGVLVGATLYWISPLGNDHGAVAFAVLLGNLFAPLLDRVSLPGAFARHTEDR